ncbi:MAG: DUF167 domain-containing protein [Alphaproteobacteria bacterium]|nr:DUF167 domain-containing protein [Alphaproteobacteria bacterium]
MAAAPSPVTPAADGLRLAVRLTPKASADRIFGVVVDDAGRAALKAAVTAAPEDGRANAALLKLLAKWLDVPRTTLSVASGHAHRSKLVHLAGDPAVLGPRIAALIEGRT